MKINKIKSLCKGLGKCLILTSQGGEQWIGCDAAIYPVEGMTITAESIPALFDLSDKEAEKMAIVEQRLESSDFHLLFEGGKEITRAKMNLAGAGGAQAVPLMVDGGVYMIRKTLEDAATGDPKYRRYYRCVNQMSQPIILVQDGMVETVAMIKPIAIGLVEWIQQELRGIAFPSAAGWKPETAPGDEAGADTERDEPDEPEEGAQLDWDDLPDAGPLEQADPEEEQA